MDKIFHAFASFMQVIFFPCLENGFLLMNTMVNYKVCGRNSISIILLALAQCLRVMVGIGRGPNLVTSGDRE